MDLNEVPRNGMEYERGIVVLANPYSEDASRKFNSVEVVFPRTGTVKYLCKLPQSVFMPGTYDTGWAKKLDCYFKLLLLLYMMT